MCDYAKAAELLGKIREILSEAAAYPMPNFFAMGYYVTFCADPLPDMPVDELNAFLRRYLDEHFMARFHLARPQGDRAVLPAVG